MVPQNTERRDEEGRKEGENGRKEMQKDGRKRRQTDRQNALYFILL